MEDGGKSGKVKSWGKGGTGEAKRIELAVSSCAEAKMTAVAERWTDEIDAKGSDCNDGMVLLFRFSSA